MTTLDQPSGAGTVCAICQTPLLSGEETTECGGCRARYHTECWQENRGCAVYGCSEVPPTETRQALEIPASYWGQEEKPCPACGKTILAAAVRCRHCGATFASARPQSRAEFRDRTGRQGRLPALRTTAVWLFIFCVLPCTAPFAALLGGVWYVSHRSDIKALPGIFPSLCMLGLVLAVGQTSLIVTLTILYAVLRS